jgi:hypothetical protein
MIARPPYGITKPPFGMARIDWKHRFVQKHLMSVLFHGQGPLHDIGAGNSGPVIYASKNNVSAFGASNNNPPLCHLLSAVTDAEYISNNEGVGLHLDLGEVLSLCTDSIFSTTQATICIIRRKTDAVNRNSALFSNGFNGAPDLFLVTCPWGDGSVNFQFGLFTVTVTGLSFSTLIPERWIFTAGPNGSSIWQNGIKVGSQSSAVSRTSNNTTVSLNFSFNASGGIGSDNQDFNFFMALDEQWPDEICRWWSAEPYAHLYPDSNRNLVGEYTESPVPPQWRSALVHVGADSSLWETIGTNSSGITDFNVDGLEFGSSLSRSGNVTKWLAFKNEGEISVASVTPTANAGPDQVVTVFSANLDGTATAGNYPCAVLEYFWSQISGPFGAIYNPAIIDPTVIFSQSGVYVFQLEVSNGAEVATDTVQITVGCDSPVSVNAGPDQEVLLGTVVQLNGTIVTVDTVTQLWTKISGPGIVTFNDDELVDPTASFSAAGVYVLSLMVTSSCAEVEDFVTITILGGDTGYCVLPSADPTFDCE